MLAGGTGAGPAQPAGATPVPPCASSLYSWWAAEGPRVQCRCTRVLRCLAPQFIGEKPKSGTECTQQIFMEALLWAGCISVGDTVGCKAHAPLSSGGLAFGGRQGPNGALAIPVYTWGGADAPRLSSNTPLPWQLGEQPGSPGGPGALSALQVSPGRIEVIGF